MGELRLAIDGVEKISFSQDFEEAIQNLANAWEAWRDLPFDEKDKLAFNPLAGYGYKARLESQGDSKELIELTHNFVNLNPYSIDRYNSNIETTQLRESGRILFSYLQPLFQDYWTILQGTQHIPTSEDNHHARVSAAMSTIRCLYYPPGSEPGTIISAPHLDKSGGTTHLYESTDGCEILTLENQNWIAMPHTKNSEAIRFGGMQAQVASDGEIRALYHRVVANETSSELGRSAIVGFMPLSNIPRYDNNRHGPANNLVPGSTYGQRHDNLYRYFHK